MSPVAYTRPQSLRRVAVAVPCSSASTTWLITTPAISSTTTYASCSPATACALSLTTSWSVLPSPRTCEQRENLRDRWLTLVELHHVKRELCHITRRQIGVAADKLYGQVELLPFGVVRLAQLQQEEGFAYIKME